jgi:hypothetical protein
MRERTEAKRQRQQEIWQIAFYAALLDKPSRPSVSAPKY